jgi:putative hydrolase of the HAD superfamily
MAQSVKAVFFDLNNTLHDDSVERFFAALEKTCQQFGDQKGIPTQRLMEAYLAGNREHYLLAAGPRDERPRLWVDIAAEIWARALTDCGYAGEAEPAAIARVLFHERLEGFKPFADAPGLLKGLAGRYILGLVTNGQADMQRGTLEALGLESYFPVVVISGELGAGKPSVEIFAEAARRAGIASHEAAHVGDSLVTDVAGAKEAGMIAIWVNRGQQRLQPHEPQPDHAVASLSEVAALLSV